MSARQQGDPLSRNIATITNCNIDATRVFGIGPLKLEAIEPMFPVSNFSEMSRDPFIYRACDNREQRSSQVGESRFARMLPRSIKTGLFENVERDMSDAKPTPLWKKGDVVNVFQLSMAKGLELEGRALIVRAMGGWNEHYMVRFYRKKDGQLQREAYERFIDREGQSDPAAYIVEFNKKIGFAA